MQQRHHSRSAFRAVKVSDDLNLYLPTYTYHHRLCVRCSVCIVDALARAHSPRDDLVRVDINLFRPFS